jgi:hypothetical protein
VYCQDILDDVQELVGSVRDVMVMALHQSCEASSQDVHATGDHAPHLPWCQVLFRVGLRYRGVGARLRRVSQQEKGNTCLYPGESGLEGRTALALVMQHSISAERDASTALPFSAHTH